jgi:hypothetical protein
MGRTTPKTAIIRHRHIYSSAVVQQPGGVLGIPFAPGTDLAGMTTKNADLHVQMFGGYVHFVSNLTSTHKRLHRRFFAPLLVTTR